MGISLLEQLRLIQSVIDNEHGGTVYNGEEYITPDWDGLAHACVVKDFHDIQENKYRST